MSQEKYKAMHMQTFGGQKSCIMGFVHVENFELHSIHSTPLGMWYIPCDWCKLTNGSDVMKTNAHRAYQTREGERGSEGAANDLGRQRIRLPDVRAFEMQFIKHGGFQCQLFSLFGRRAAFVYWTKKRQFPRSDL